MSSKAAGAVAVLDRGLAAVAEVVDDADLCDAGLLDLLRQLEVRCRRLDAQRSRLVDRVHRRGAGRLDGASSTAAWLRSRLHLSDPGRQVHIAAAAGQVPEVGDAYARGEISADHVAVVARVLPDLDQGVLEAGAGKLLAEHAAQLTPQALGRVAVRIRDHFDPPGGERRGRELIERRWLRVATTFDGAVAVDGMLDSDGGRLLLETLRALTPPPSPGDRRSGPQRRADALVDLCRLASTSVPTAGGEKPHVTVTVDLATLAGATNPDGPAGGARLGDHTTITPGTARRLACDATIIPAVLGGAGEVLDLGRAARLPNAAQRRGLVLRDRGCRFPGCDRPPPWTDAHHVQHWANGGPTNLHNLVLLCRWHHTAVHEGGWRLRLDSTTNTVTATRPDGRPLDLISRPPAQPP